MDGVPLRIMEFDRGAAVRYAHKWAYGRNPVYFNYESMGGDCTSFASQCLFAGSRVMNFTPTFGWYYRSGNDKAPAWTGVVYLYNFLTRKLESVGPFAREAELAEALPGDILQLSLDGLTYQHSPVIVRTGQIPAANNILLAAHSIDSDYRPLASYSYKKARLLHILGMKKR